MKMFFAAAAIFVAVLLGLNNASASPLAQRTLTPTLALTRTQTSTLTLTKSAITPITETPRASVTITRTNTLNATPSQTATDTPTASKTVEIATVAPTNDLSSTITPTTLATDSIPGSSSTDAPRTLVAAAPRYDLSLDVKSLSIDSLRARKYYGSPIKITRVISSDEAFKRVLFEYSSDGLKITGMMHVPRGTGPFPVVILDHGYFKPSEYKTGDGTIRAADYFARYGYLTLAPDYRCYGGSQCGSNPVYVGYAIDVLNLIASLPTLSYADTTRLGIWGHSMGGGITLRVLTVNESIKVAALYGALTGDDEAHYCWLYSCKAPLVPPKETVRLNAPRLREVDPDFIAAIPPPEIVSNDPKVRLHEIFQKSSPSHYYSNINAATIVNHGEKDEIVPIQWSVDLTDALTALGKPSVLYTYPGEGHVFAGWNWQLFMARTVSFFNDNLGLQQTPITAKVRVLRRESTILDSSF